MTVHFICFSPHRSPAAPLRDVHWNRSRASGQIPGPIQLEMP